MVVIVFALQQQFPQLLHVLDAFELSFGHVRMHRLPSLHSSFTLLFYPIVSYVAHNHTHESPCITVASNAVGIVHRMAVAFMSVTYENHYLKCDPV